MQIVAKFFSRDRVGNLLYCWLLWLIYIWRQSITWANDDLQSFGPSGTNLKFESKWKIFFEEKTFATLSTSKCQTFCSGLVVLILLAPFLQMSLPMSTLVCGLWVTMGSGLFAAICEKVSWLHYIYYLSYIKVSTTPIKYFPQVSWWMWNSDIIFFPI